MYNSNKYKFLIFILVLVGFSSCFKDTDNFIGFDDVSQTWSQQPKSALDISGQIFDEQNNPLENVTIKVAAQTVITDKNGFFAFKKVSENHLHTYIQAEKTGFFKGSRVITCSKNANNVVKIILLKKNIIATFNADKTTNVKVGKANISFSRNSFQTSDGKRYSGNVNVEAKYLDPNKIETYSQMPGNLQGITAKGEDRVLGSYGMIVCELTGDNGQSINLIPDSSATITIPVTSKFQSDQKTVPLWHFDEKIGTWREEGFSTLEGNNYVGKVHHFSFWNCDYPFPYVNFKTTVKDENGKPLAGITVLLCFKKDSLGVNTGHGFTNEKGEAEGKVPKNQEMTYKIIDPNCGAVIYSQQVGPFNSDADLPISLNVPTLPSLIYKVNGKLQDCNFAPVKNGYAEITVFLKNGNTISSLVAPTDSLGNFAATVINSKCLSSADIDYANVKAIDFTNKKEGLATKIPLVKGNNDIGTIATCTSLSEYIDLDINGTNVLMTVTFAEGNLYISGQGDSTNTSKQTFFQISVLAIPNPGIAGNYTGQIGQTIMHDGKVLVFGPGANIPVNITKYASVVGEYYEGEINPAPSVIIKDAIGVDQTIKGKFKIKRKF